MTLSSVLRIQSSELPNNVSDRKRLNKGESIDFCADSGFGGPLTIQAVSSTTEVQVGVALQLSC